MTWIWSDMSKFSRLPSANWTLLTSCSKQSESCKTTMYVYHSTTDKTSHQRWIPQCSIFRGSDIKLSKRWENDRAIFLVILPPIEHFWQAAASNLNPVKLLCMSTTTQPTRPAIKDEFHSVVYLGARTLMWLSKSRSIVGENNRIIDIHPVNLHPDFRFEKSRFVSNPRKNSGSTNPDFFRVTTLQLGYTINLIRIQVLKSQILFMVATWKNLRCHPQNHFSGCRSKGWFNTKRPISS